MHTRFLQSMTAFGLVVSAGLLLSGQSVKLDADVPFEFTAGTTTFLAGACTVTTTTIPGVIQVRSAVDGRSAFLTASSGAVEHGTEVASFTFHRYGNRYFLSAASSGSRGTAFRIQTSPLEREQSRLAGNRTVLTVLAKR